jgi:cytochrome c-type biogenesis protein
MVEISHALAVSSFAAGVLMFLAPCTLPLVPAYLAFISGVKPNQDLDERVRRKIILNGFLYVLGFSVVFVTLGVLAGLAGVLVGALRQTLLPIAGVLIVLFGLQMLHVLRLEQWFTSFNVAVPAYLQAGRGPSAFVVGAAFALGWTPCVGPILASVLLLAGTHGTVLGGALLLSLFALGLAIPFLLVAFLYAEATDYIRGHQRLLAYVEMIGGGFLVLIGLLLFFNNFELTILYGYKILEWLGFGSLLNYY